MFVWNNRFYRKMTSNGVMKRAGGSEDKDLIDLEGSYSPEFRSNLDETRDNFDTNMLSGTIMGTLATEYVRAVPAQMLRQGFRQTFDFMAAIQKGRPAIDILMKVAKIPMFGVDSNPNLPHLSPLRKRSIW